MEATEKQVFEAFATQLCEWSKTGKIPDAGNQDISYGLKMQKDRLNKCHARMEYNLKLRGEQLDNISEYTFTDIKYTNRLVSRDYDKTVNYYIEERKCLSVKDKEVFHTIITRLNDKNTAQEETYCCPNCGNISEIKALTEGCPYCNTKFLMSDLFPKVTNFYFLRDYSLNSKESKSIIEKSLFIGALAGMLLASPSAITNFMESSSLAGKLFFTIWALVLGGVLGACGGYAVKAMSLIIGIIKDAIKQTPRVIGQLDAKKTLTDFMKAYDPGFSFPYFFSKVQSLLKILIFTDDRSNLAVYEGVLQEKIFDNIIDAQFSGAISLNKCKAEGEYCYLDLNVYMTDVYCKNNRIYQKSDVFQMGLCKNISRPVDLGFSIKKVCCKNCGGSFDASKERNCPYCQSSYDLKSDDWVITFIRKKS